MEILRGIGVSPGVAISPAYLLGRQDFVIATRMVDPDQAAQEIERVREAVVVAAETIRVLRTRLADTLAEKYAAVLDAHLAILTDQRLFDEIAGRIRHDGFSAEHAASRVLGEYARQLSSVEDAYLSQRATDIFDIQQRLLKALSGDARSLSDNITHPVIIIAHDLTPSETLSLDRSKITGFATDAGSSTSHTAILAKALDIPAVVGVGRATAAVAGGDMVIIDGSKGLLIISPDQETLERYRGLADRGRVAEVALEGIRDLPAETTDGRLVELVGNIELPEEVQTAVDNGAAGVGLYRTEFLYLKAGKEPTEEEQFTAYMQAAITLGDLPLTIRTFDLGGDKLPAGFVHVHERNPSLGCRSIRFCFENLPLFKTQLRAILRAAIYGNIRLLLPMISCVDEVIKAKRIIEETRRDLAADGIPFQEDLPIGIMVEVPSVAVAPDIFAPEVDFFSIGTNDLVQYCLAVERVNEHVANLFTPSHPSVLRLLKNVVDIARATDTPLALCGEIGADPVFTMLLVGLGFEQLSLNPLSIPRIKKLIRLMSYADAETVASQALIQKSADDVRKLLLESIPEEARTFLA